MGEQTADSLVIVMTQGVSLRSWRESGILAREWALHRLLKPHYGRLVIVSFGGPDDAEHLRPLLALGEADGLIVVSNTAGSSARDYAASLPALLATTLAGTRSAVVRTTQMAGGETAIAIRDGLRAAGVTAALLARGGFLWSRFVAVEVGAGTSEARRAGESEGRLCQQADIVAGSTGKMADDLAWRYCLREERLRVVPNYVLLDRPPRLASERKSLAQGDGTRSARVLLSVGQLTVRKRYAMLIEALGMLEDELRGRLVLRLIGEGPERPALEAMAAEQGVGLEITPYLPHDQLLDLMGSCELYVQSSSIEGHPKAVLEAMALGTPVIVADAPGLSSILEHGLTGLKAAGNARGFAHAISGLLDDESWQDALGSAAAAATRERYGLPAVVELELDAERAAMAHAARAAEEAATLRRAG